jgi:hypothetical protein
MLVILLSKDIEYGEKDEVFIGISEGSSGVMRSAQLT